MERFTVHYEEGEDVQEIVDQIEAIGVSVSVIDEQARIVQGKVDDDDISAFIDLNLNIEW